MASRFQAAALVASPSYPKAIAWSEENLIAVASGHLVTILNPALPFGPRGLITLPSSEPFPIGVIQREDLLSACLLPTCLNRDPRPCVRSLAWSHIGMAPNSGCLLAVCTTEGRIKIYRPPFCDFCAEWIQVMDITDMLCDYLSRISFGELNVLSFGFSKEQVTELGFADDELISVLRKQSKRRRVNGQISKCSKTCRKQSSSIESSEDIDAGFSTSTEMVQQWVPEVFKITDEENSCKSVSMSKAQVKVLNKTPKNCPIPLITTDQYASRSAMLSSLVVAWSPMLHVPYEISPIAQNGASNCFSLLAVGGKSGKISIWRIYAPECYYIEHSNVSISVVLIGLLQAHNSWITTISWGLLDSDSSNPQVFLATGSSDGSVRIWLGCTGELLKSSEVNNSPMFLLKEVITPNTIPVSAVSLTVPIQPPRKMLLAVGKGSGSFEVWICDICSRKFDKAGSYDAHDQVVTGLAWGFGGHCLYSCSQDNFVRSWILHGSSLSEVPMPSNTPGLRSPTDLPDVFLSCLGVALSPGNLVVAMVRSFNVDLLDQMYQARAQKAAVEFFWNGAQQCNVLSNNYIEIGIEAFPGFPREELDYWESNIFWSLKQYEHVRKPLVIWDLVAALLAFKKSIPKYVEYIVVKWLSMSYLGSHIALPTEKVLSHVSKRFSEVASRQLHLLNVITRCIMLSELKADQINSKVQNLRGIHDAEDKQLSLWLEVLLRSERELRERLVGFTFSSSLSLACHSATTASHLGYWNPNGLTQMEQWVALNHDDVRDELKVLASEIKTYERRVQLSMYAAEDECCYCSAAVPFDSPEVAVCQGLVCNNGIDQKHRLERCAVSMMVCPAASLWFCKCCHRWTSKLAPETLFTMPRYPLDLKSLTESSVVKEISKPLCPFCGILLQRLQPEFLLSASPV